MRVAVEGPPGICLDADGAVWAGAADYLSFRVAEGGEVPQHVGLAADRVPFALMLGGADRRTPFIMTAEWRPADGLATCGGWPPGPAPGRS